MKKLRSFLELRWIANLTAGSLLALALAIGAAVFYVWVTFLQRRWLGGTAIIAALPPEGSRNWGLAGGAMWGMIEGLSSAAAVAVTIAASLFVVVQLRKSIESRSLTEYKDIFEKMMSKENVEARTWLFRTLPNYSEDEIVTKIMQDKDGKKHAKTVLFTLDYLGFLLENDPLIHKAIIGWVSPMVVKSWMVLKPFVDYQRDVRNEPDYYNDAEELWQKCVEWRKKKSSRDNLVESSGVIVNGSFRYA